MRENVANSLIASSSVSMFESILSFFISISSSCVSCFLFFACAVLEAAGEKNVDNDDDDDDDDEVVEDNC